MLRLFSGLLLAVMTVPVAALAQGATPATVQFSLGPGDVVRVQIWRERDLDGEFQVDETGRLTLPLLGPRQVIGVPWATLRDSLLSAYARELKAPSVILTPLRRVQVLGEVTKPGVYLVDPTMSLASAAAMAGGASPLGDLGHLRVVRDGRTIIDNASVEGQLLKAGVQSDDQIFVERRSWFDRNSAFVASAVISVASVLVMLLKR